MEDIKYAIYIAFELIAVTVVLGVGFVGLNLSRDLLSSGIDAAISGELASDSAFTQAVQKTEGETIPAAACYTLLAAHYDIISSCKCNICGLTTSNGSCLETHLDGRVKLSLTDNGDGTLSALITS